MRVVVCAKQIPDPAAPYQLEEGTNFLVRPEDQVLDDTDRYGIEVGLQIAEQTEGSVTIVSMGPTGSQQGIRQALAMGADDAVIIDDAALRGADALTTAKVLAATIGRREWDLVIAGTESTDGYSGVVPQQLAELLDVASLTFARRVSLDGGVIVAERQTAGGYDEVTGTPPLLLAVTSGAVEPRYPTFKGIMQAKSKPVETLTVADLGVDIASGQDIVAVEEAPARSAGAVVEDDGSAHLKIIEVLEEAKVL